MKQSSLFAAWGIAFIICAGLGFIPDPQGGIRIFLAAVSLAFFLPPVLLLLDGDQRCRRLIRNLSALSLLLTLLLLVLNILAAVRSESLGMFLHVVLTIVSAPMMSSYTWAWSLFCWACLLMGSLAALKKK